jgi:hypothetical protein
MRKITYFSLDMAKSLEFRESLDSGRVDILPGHLTRLVDAMKIYDPKGRRAHELAKKYRK